MLKSKQMHVEVELVKWLVLMALAAALAVAWASRAGGTETTPLPDRAPGLLPPGMESLAQPLATLPEGLVTESPELRNLTPRDEVTELNARIWMALDLHRRGQVEQAVMLWHSMSLPWEAEAWRYVALSAGYLQMGSLDEASAALTAALLNEPENAVAHYYAGILRLQQAENAPQWLDGVEPGEIRLAGFLPHVVPNTRSMYEMTAMMEFERALEMASTVERERVIVVPEDTAAGGSYAERVLPVLPPTIGDLLFAIGADNFEGKAHHMLGDLCLRRAMLGQAEEHLDAAAASGLTIVYGFDDVGKAYAAEGRYSDAFRANLKAMAHSGRLAAPAVEAVRNLRRALLGE